MPHVLRTVLITAIMLALWELIGQFGLIAGRAFPPPSAILADWTANAIVYGKHVRHTLRSAGLGFVIGTSIAILAGILFVQVPLIERISRGVSITLFAVPPITIGPILVICFPGAIPQIILAAMTVYFPTMVATMIGLREIDPRPLDVVSAYGGTRLDQMRFVRLRGALPGILSGLQVAAPAAMLGAILGEFGAGTRWGLGSFLLGSLGQADPARIWGIGLAATAIAACGYAIFDLIGRALLGQTMQVTVAANSAPDRLGQGTPLPPAQRALITLATLSAPFLIWALVLYLLDLNPIIARGPLATFDYLFLAERAPEAQARLLAALAETVPAAALGMALGLATAFLLAALSVLTPTVARLLMPPSLVLQTMPLVALTPIIVLIFGRDLAAILAVTVAVVFFPAFVTLAQGFASVPRGALDVARTYGNRPMKSLFLVSVPYALPHLFAAARLVAPRALLGAMIAEWLATGTGVGQLLNASRGLMDYGMIWSTALVSVVVAVLAYQSVAVIERIALSR
ncbi:MAG: ABC transporter permease [Qingshengfaniella sp.]